MSSTKSGLRDLAVFGGPAAFDSPLHVGTPNIGNRQQLHERLDDILDRRWLSNRGRYVQEFEERVADLVGVKHCIATCNGTLALEIAIRALGLKGEVLVPSFTFVATAHALQWQEITPVFCDIDPRTYNLDPDGIEKMLTPRTTGIIGVHLWGRPCDVDRLGEIAADHQLTLLYDASHAFGCTHHGRRIGRFGAAEVFSFHATKFLNAFEGGALVTNDDELATKARLMKNFGFADTDKVIHVGSNGKMNEMSAAMGLTSLESMEEFTQTNYRHYKHYEECLGRLPGVSLVTYDDEEQCNFQYIILDIDPALTAISRDDLLRVLHAERVLARRYFYPGCHRMEPYRSYFPHAGLLLPVTERVADRVLSLPTGTAIASEQITHICQIIAFAVRNGAAITRELQQRGSPSGSPRPAPVSQ